MQYRTFTRLALAPLAVAALLAAPGAAQAGAIFHALGYAKLTLTAVNGGSSIPTGVTITAETAINDLDSSHLGEASADAVVVHTPGAVPVPIGIGGETSQAPAVTGEAGERTGSASAFAESDGIISIENNSGDTVVLTFAYDVATEVLAQLSGNGLDAFAFAAWSLFDDLGFIALDYSVFADGLLGPSINGFDDKGSFDITLADGESDSLVSLMDFDGFADAPAPPVLALLAVGLVPLLGRRRRVAQVRA